mmetsp:Transcript_2848/g.5629  ORF Transcript_2848/g.5629 Transcript_2848/m.5629 type:complete len:86 (-) Transcript_2848:553-810(-)
MLQVPCDPGQELEEHAVLLQVLPHHPELLVGLLLQVMLPTTQERPTNAKTSTSTAKIHSARFCGCTWMEEGVNCVIPQWNAATHM